MQTIQKPQTLSLSDIEGVRIGHAGDDKAKTGVTVLYFPKGAYCGVDISGSVTADINVVGVLAAQVMAEAIENAVTHARISEEEFLANISYSSSGPSS